MGLLASIALNCCEYPGEVDSSKKLQTSQEVLGPELRSTFGKIIGVSAPAGV